MFTFRKLTLGFIILLFALNLTHFFACHNNWLDGHICTHTSLYIIILFCIYVGIAGFMAFFIKSGFHYPAICRVNISEKKYSLTFDDGPEPEKTSAILEMLNRHDIKGSFFLIGHKLTGNEQLIREMFQQGHLICNHSWSHSYWFDFFSSRRMRKEILKTAEKIEEITGKSTSLFRPPYGVINPMLSNALKGLGYRVIGWSFRSFDTIYSDPDKIIARILSNIRPGSILVFHDYVSNVPEILIKIIPALKELGYSCVSLDHLLETNAYA